MTVNLRTIDLNTQVNNTSVFPIDKTLIGFKQIKLRSERKGLIDNWLGELKTRFPKAIQAIDNKINDNEEVASDLRKFRGGTLASDELMEKCFNYFNIEDDVLVEAKPATIDKVNDSLISKDDDSEVIKFLKTVASGEQETYKAIFESWEAGVSGLIFATDSIKNFYLDYLPNNYIKEHLNKEPVITWGELDQAKLKEIANDIFAVLYSGFTQLEEESNLESFKNDINSNLEKIKKLINDTRDSKKPTENIEAIKQELADLKEAWNKNFADRGLRDKEWLKNKELSVKSINEVASGLKTYDDTFKSEPFEVRNWWNKTKMYWESNFANKPDINWYGRKIEGKPLDNSALNIINMYIQSIQSDLRDYHGVFDSVNESSNEVKKWWEAFDTAWKAYKFDEKYGKIDFDSLGKIKIDLDKQIPSSDTSVSSNEELNKWINTFPVKEYPKGAEDVKSNISDLEQIAKDLFDKIKRYDEDPNIFYEVPPTPPNSPDTKPVKPDDDIPPIKN